MVASAFWTSVSSTAGLSDDETGGADNVDINPSLTRVPFNLAVSIVSNKGEIIMVIEQEVQSLHTLLKPQAVTEYIQFFLSRTKPEWQATMVPIVEADLGGSGIAYAYIDVQTITG